LRGRLNYVTYARPFFWVETRGGRTATTLIAGCSEGRACKNHSKWYTLAPKLLCNFYTAYIFYKRGRNSDTHCVTAALPITQQTASIFTGTVKQLVMPSGPQLTVNIYYFAHQDERPRVMEMGRRASTPMALLL